MTNRSLLLFFFLSLSVTRCFAAPQTTPPASFGGGLNLKTANTDIGETETPDSSNVINDRYGTAQDRNGSVRYIDQALSTNPVSGLYRLVVSSGINISKALIATNWHRIIYSTNDVNPVWLSLSSGHVDNQRWSFAYDNNKLYMSGDKLSEPMIRFDLLTSSALKLFAIDNATQSVIIRAKHLFTTRGYMLAGNVVRLSTETGAVEGYYPERFYYSLLSEPSSFTALRFINITEHIQGFGELNGMVHIFGETSIFELDFNVLNLTVNLGDQTMRQLVKGFGLFAPYTLANIGDFYIFGSKDGIRFFDGGRKNRLKVEEESKIISAPIQPILDRLIRAGTYKYSVGMYYPKKNWYLFAYDDPDKLPAGRNDSLLVFDLINASWFPFSNWNCASFETLDGFGDSGDLLCGDSGDGYVYKLDQDKKQNDFRKELTIDNMDSTATLSTVLWNGGTTSYHLVREGSGSIKISLHDTQLATQTYRMGVFNFGEYPDQSAVSKSDKLAFKLYLSSQNNLTSLRVDLEINDVDDAFDLNYTSVTISSATLGLANTRWVDVEIALSSFTILDNWVALSAEDFPFADTLTFYGIRFYASGVGSCQLFIDDLRVVQGSENSLNPYRETKTLNFGSAVGKTFKELLLNVELGSDSDFFIDYIKNFGEFSKRVRVSGPFRKELYVSGYGGTDNITKLSSIDFSFIESTQAGDQSYFAVRPLVVDETHIYGGDQYNNRIIKISKSSMTSSIFVSTYGSLGSGSTNFNLIYQITCDDSNIYVCDFANNRVKAHRKSDLSFLNSYGTVGTVSTSVHNPTGIAVDERFLYVGSDGNGSVLKLLKSTFGFISATNLNLNTIGDTTLAVDERDLYVAYNSISDKSVEAQDVFLEIRDKNSMLLKNKTILRPFGSVLVSSYAIMGDISVSDDFVYVSFTDDVNANGSYYVQKRLKSDLSLVLEYKGSGRHFALSHNGLAYKSKRKTIKEEIGLVADYLAVRFSQTGLDNNLKLYNMAFTMDPLERPTGVSK